MRVILSSTTTLIGEVGRDEKSKLSRYMHYLGLSNYLIHEMKSTYSCGTYDPLTGDKFLHFVLEECILTNPYLKTDAKYGICNARQKMKEVM